MITATGLSALSLGHLKFLRNAPDELLATRSDLSANIAAAYAARCAEIGDQGDRLIARQVGTNRTVQGASTA